MRVNLLFLSHSVSFSSSSCCCLSCCYCCVGGICLGCYGGSYVLKLNTDLGRKILFENTFQILIGVRLILPEKQWANSTAPGRPKQSNQLTQA